MAQGLRGSAAGSPQVRRRVSAGPPQGLRSPPQAPQVRRRVSAESAAGSPQGLRT
eukprot:gene15870-21087_t